MSFPETVSDSLCRNSLVMQTDCCSSCPGGWSQTILEVKILDVEVSGLRGERMRRGLNSAVDGRIHPG